MAGARPAQAAACVSGLTRVRACVRQELEVLRFNTVDNRSGEWGTQPSHWCARCTRLAVRTAAHAQPRGRYFTSALPRALLGAAPLMPLGMLWERRLWPQAAAALLYVLLYSHLPHKARCRVCCAGGVRAV